MDLLIIFYFLLILFFFIYSIKFIRRDHGKKLNLPPSPPKLPIIGNLHQLGTLPHRTLKTLSAKYGPVMLLHFGTSPTLIISSADLAREVIKTHDVNFSDRPLTLAGDILFFHYKDIAFCPYSDYWRETKKICVVELLSQKRVKEFQFAREQEVANMVERIRSFCRGGGVVDIGEMITSVTNNVVSRSALGRVYERGEGDASLAKLIREAQDLLGDFCFTDLIPYLGWMDVLTGLTGRLKRVTKELHNFLDQVIDEHQGKRGKSLVDKKDIVDILLDLQNKGTLVFQLTRDNLKAILLDMFIGGTDTSGTTMEWAMTELARHPIIMKKAQQEVRKVVGSKPKIDETDLDQMEYLKCVLKESLRLHAPAMVPRKSIESMKLDGYDIPPKTTVLINTCAIQRDPKVWDRPEEFIPERFKNLSVDFKGQHSQLLPFGAGRRICPGLAFAIVEAELVLANLLCWFDWKLPRGGKDVDMTEKYGFVVRKKLPLLLIPKLHSP